MSALFILRALLTAGECFFGATLILAAGFLLTRAGTAAQRHLVWAGAFAALLVLPVFAVLVPPQVVFELAAAPARIPAAAAPAAPPFGVAEVILLLVAVWFAGMAFLLARLAAGWCGLALLKRRSVPHIPENVDAARFASAPAWEVRLRTVPGEMGAMTWGVFKAVVLLPKTSVRWPRERLESVLLHEFAHVRRRDSLARLIAALACALYWPNPFVWAAARRMRCDAEIAADDAVLEAGVRPSVYAEQLLGLAGVNGSYSGVSLAMAEPSTLKHRVESVLSANQSRSGVTKMDVLKVAMLGAAAVTVLALMRPTLAEAQPSPDVHVVAEPSDPVPVTQAVAADPSDDAPQALADTAPLPAPAPAPQVLPPVPPPPAPAHAAMPPIAPVAPLPPLPPVECHRACRADVRESVQQAMRQAHAAIAEARRVNADAIRQAMAEMRAHEADIRRAAEEVRRVNADAIRQAVAQAHIAETVKKAMAEAQPEIERAMAHMREEMRKAAREAHEHNADHDADEDGGDDSDN